MTFTAAVLISLGALGQVDKAEDDAKIVGTAMLEFFKKADWNWSGTHGDVVVVRPQWARNERPDFVQELDTELRSYGSKPTVKKVVAELSRIKADLASDGVGYEPMPVAEVASLKLPKQVVIGELDYRKAGRRGWSSGLYKIKDSTGTEGTARIIARLSPPAYARNGRHAVLTAGVPWAVHSGSLRFFMTRTADGWKVSVVTSHYYP